MRSRFVLCLLGTVTSMASLTACRKKSARIAVEAFVVPPAAPVAFSPGALAGLPLTMTLKNSNDVAVAVSAFAPDNISVRRVRCDGVDLVPEESLVPAFAPPSVYASGAIEQVAVGAALRLDLSGVRGYAEHDGTTTVANYRVPHVGTCTVSLRYAYDGPDGGHKQVFRGPVDLPAFEVTFK